jgi:hypothetical protein
LLPALGLPIWLRRGSGREQAAEGRGAERGPGLFRQIPDLVDLNQSFTRRQQLFDAGPTPNDEVFEGRVATIAAGDPDNLGWRSTALQDLNEVVVFGDDHGLHLTSLLENLGVLGSEKAKVLNVHRSALTKVT